MALNGPLPTQTSDFDTMASESSFLAHRRQSEAASDGHGKPPARASRLPSPLQRIDRHDQLGARPSPSASATTFLLPRKRAAASMVEEDEDEDEDEAEAEADADADADEEDPEPILSPPSTGGTLSAAAAPATGSGVAQICLCPPEPKIPRPRNAFMLYRQHFQSHVVAQHPGLPNPEISKIIGRQWKREPQEVRNTWDALAEEEKARHQQQYPHYRYQPRRKGKKPGALDGLPSKASLADEWCVKCGRRNITSPSTPGTPYLPRPTIASTMATPRLPPPPPPPPLHPASHGPMMMYTRPGDHGPARGAPGDAGSMTVSTDGRGRPRFGGRSIDMGQVRESLEEDVVSPTAHKRRRLLPPYSWGPATPIQAPANGMAPPPLPQQPLGRRISSGAPGRMDPPMRPPQPARGLPDPSLTLAPLQNGPAAGKSVKEQILAIPCLNKLRVLSKICPPLRVSGSARGAAIAVDGENLAAVAEVSKWLADGLSREDELAVRIFEGPAPSETAVGDGDGDGDGDGSGGDNSGSASFLGYLQHIADWHRRSAELVPFLTMSSPSSTAGPGPNATTTTGAHPTTADPPVTAASDLAAVAAAAAGAPPPPSPKAADDRRPIPVAILPGYMLTRTNHAAIHIPIQDAYTPADHWQWAATLWRGIVGPDLTIWVKERCGREEMARYGNVEVREEARAVVVRIEIEDGGGGGVGGNGGNVGGDDGSGGNGGSGGVVVGGRSVLGGVDVRAQRRLTFEVGDWIRSISTRRATKRGLE
ncbi:MAG: hypothetical protein M1826_007482 [Phylliscum demangeonii]|nr:MAG: hypothetical protein M1826_007482 [Phylliscum demangeonii]